MTAVRETDRWLGVTAMALAAIGAGLLWTNPPLLLASVVAVGYAAYARSATAPEPALRVEREVDASEPAPEEAVSVTTVVRNEGSTLFDLRVFDGVPDALAVTDGTARANVALSPGSSHTLRYEVTATRGEHVWGPVTALARDESGASERETAVEGPDTTVTCIPSLAPVETFPLQPVTTRHAGRVPSRAAGDGVEFHSRREYRPGDPLGHVDWHHLARTGDLATTQFRAERMATVVLLFDVRPATYAATPDGEHEAVGCAFDAGRRLLGRLLDDGNRVGIAGLGVETCWLGPGLGREHRARAERFLATAEPLSSTPPEGRFLPSHLHEIRKRLRGAVQVVWLSPLVDRYGPVVARRLATAGHPVSVVSPDVTAEETAGQRVARAERRVRMAGLREAGIRVVDWRPPESLDVAITRDATSRVATPRTGSASASRGWSR